MFRGRCALLLLLALTNVSCGDPQASKPADTEALTEAPRTAPKTKHKRHKKATFAAAAAAIQTPPPPSPFPLYGVATNMYANIYRTPVTEENILGYMRKGAHFRARTASVRRGCSQGWVELEHGGYVCPGKGYTVGEEPTELDDAPIPPALTDALPYAYGYTVRNDVPQYASLPDLKAEDASIASVRTLRAWEAAQAAAAGTVDADAGVPATPLLVGNSRPDTTVAGVPPLPEVLKSVMLKGFYVSLDGLVEGDPKRQFLRTVRGTFVRDTDLLRNVPPSSRGVVLGDDWQLPIAIAYRKGAYMYREHETKAQLVDGVRIDRQMPLRIADLNHIIDGQKYIETPDGIVTRESNVRVITSIARPQGIPANAQWIHVNLANQSLVAYEGNTPVFATVVSSGKEGHTTPTGLFRIQSKHVSATMDDFGAEGGAYSIEDVPWTMYFYGNFALHGAFWHYSFGNVRSHGCVNLSPADARWLFFWSTPQVPAEWHAAYADTKHPGTFVYITP